MKKKKYQIDFSEGFFKLSGQLLCVGLKQDFVFLVNEEIKLFRSSVSQLKRLMQQRTRDLNQIYVMYSFN